MRLTRMDLRLLQEGLDHVIADAQEYLEVRSDDATICRWADETIDQAQTITQKLDIIIETLTNLHSRNVEADVILAPGAKNV